MKLLFLFNSVEWLEDENVEFHQNFGFFINEIGYFNMCKNKPDGETNTSHFSNLIQPYVDEFENEYGTHDYCGSESDEFESICYESSEVEDFQLVELITKWRQVFVDLAGENNVSEFTEFVGHVDFNDLKNLYERILKDQ